MNIVFLYDELTSEISKTGKESKTGEHKSPKRIKLPWHMIKNVSSDFNAWSFTWKDDFLKNLTLFPI